MAPNRFRPALPVHAFKTYGIFAPVATHFRLATCEDVDCPAMANGWVTKVHEASELGQMQAHYIRSESRRSFREERTPDGLTEFTFPAGQRCFRQHRAKLEREPIYTRRLGDWRGNPSGGQSFTHRRAEDWIEDFANHQENISNVFEKG